MELPYKALKTIFFQELFDSIDFYLNNLNKYTNFGPLCIVESQYCHPLYKLNNTVNYRYFWLKYYFWKKLRGQTVCNSNVPMIQWNLSKTVQKT